MTSQSPPSGENSLIQAVANAVVTRRLQKNISQEDLCRLSGLSKSVVVRLEHGLLDLDISTLRKLSSALQLSVSEFLKMVESGEFI